MAEHSEIPSAWAGLAAAGTFIGGLLAVLFGPFKMPGRQPEKGDGMAMVLQRIAKLEQRADDCDQRETDRHVWRDQVFGRLLDLDKKTSTILAILDERKHER